MFTQSTVISIFFVVGDGRTDLDLVCDVGDETDQSETRTTHYTGTHILSLSLSLSLSLADRETTTKLKCQRRHLRSAAGRQLVVPSELMWPSGVLCTRSETVELFA